MAAAEVCDFPEVVLLNIFSYLPLKDLAVACCVSKKWNEIARLDVVWKKFIPLQEHLLLEDKSAYEMAVHMWRSSVKVGEERWYPNPLPELVEFDSELRKAECQQLMLDDNSTMTLMLRLNPIYDFTTKGIDDKEICKMIWNNFGFVDGNALEITNYKEMMQKSVYRSKQEALDSILTTLQPYWFVEELKLEPYELDEEGMIVSGGNEVKNVSDDDDDGGDDDYAKRNLWKENFNKPVSVDLYQKLKAVFADKSEHFIEYYLSDGCFNENDRFAHSLVISDTAAYHIIQIYDL